MTDLSDLHKHRFTNNQIQALLPESLRNHGPYSFAVRHAIAQLYRGLLKTDGLTLPTSSEVAAFRGQHKIPMGISYNHRILVHLAEEKLRALPTIKGTTQVTKSNQLFRVIGSDPEIYVTLLATDSSGKSVVEQKGTGKIFSIDPDKIEKVLPYTVGVKFATSSTVYNYLSAKGQVQKGDILLCSRHNTVSFAVVTEIDTKSEQATATLDDSFDGILITKALK